MEKIPNAAQRLFHSSSVFARQGKAGSAGIAYDMARQCVDMGGPLAEALYSNFADQMEARARAL